MSLSLVEELRLQNIRGTILLVDYVSTHEYNVSSKFCNLFFGVAGNKDTDTMIMTLSEHIPFHHKVMEEIKTETNNQTKPFYKNWNVVPAVNPLNNNPILETTQTFPFYSSYIDMIIPAATEYNELDEMIIMGDVIIAFCTKQQLEENYNNNRSLFLDCTFYDKPLIIVINIRNGDFIHAELIADLESKYYNSTAIIINSDMLDNSHGMSNYLSLFQAITREFSGEKYIKLLRAIIANDADNCIKWLEHFGTKEICKQYLKWYIQSSNFLWHKLERAEDFELTVHQKIDTSELKRYIEHYKTLLTFKNKCADVFRQMFIDK